MAKPRVFATHELFPEARTILDAVCDVEYYVNPERPPRDEFLRRVKDKEGLVCMLTEKINDELLRGRAKASPRLQCRRRFRQYRRRCLHQTRSCCYEHSGRPR